MALWSQFNFHPLLCNAPLQVSIQAPPNLTPEADDVAGSEAADPAAGWRALLDAGINDWGGKLAVGCWLVD